MIHAREDYNRIQDPAGKIGEDEPVFLLRAKDLLAPQTVEAWAMDLQLEKGDPKLVRRALEHAKLMREWQKNNTAKLPDL